MVEKLNGINGKNRMDKSHFDARSAVVLGVLWNTRDVTQTPLNYVNMWNRFYSEIPKHLLRI